LFSLWFTEPLVELDALPRRTPHGAAHKYGEILCIIKRSFMTRTIIRYRVFYVNLNGRDSMDSLFYEPTDEQQVRTQLALVIGGRKTIPEAAWEVLVGQGHVEDFLEGRITWERLVEIAKPLTFYGDLVEHAEALPKPRDKPSDREGDVQTPHVGVYEEERARTFAEYLELRVAGDPGVLRWRRDCLGSTRPLSPEEAYMLALYKSSVLYTSDMTGYEYALSHHGSKQKGELKFFVNESGEIMIIPFYEGSSLDRLHGLSEKLRGELFPDWSVAEASWVVLTGKVREAPRCLVGEVESLSNEHLTRKVVTLRVEPWIAAETVLRTYQYLQALTLGRRPRAVSERNLAMVRFVMKQLHTLITTPLQVQGVLIRVSWRKLMDSWNRENEESWAYEDERRFYRDCHRTLRTIVRPYDGTSSPDREIHSSLEVTIPEDDAEDDAPRFIRRRE
jgi:hypothetical protein